MPSRLSRVSFSLTGSKGCHLLLCGTLNEDLVSDSSDPGSSDGRPMQLLVMEGGTVT